jgi:hypothetical protein
MIRFDQRRWDKAKKREIVVRCYHGEATDSVAWVMLSEEMPRWVVTAHGRLGGVEVVKRDRLIDLRFGRV